MRSIRPMTRAQFAGFKIIVISILAACAAARDNVTWSKQELAAIRDLWIAGRDSLKADPSNRFSMDTAAASLGAALFNDVRLSSNGKVSCASCHMPDKQFQDGIALSKGVGTTNRRAMPIKGTAHSPWMFWDGRKDTQWSQALGPLESPVEHGGTRAQYAHLIAEQYRERYEQVFGALPRLDGVPRVAGPVADSVARSAWEALPEARREDVTRVYVNIGKSIAAFERTLEHRGSRFDDYVAKLVAEGRAPEGILSDDELAGLKIFVGKGNCTQCHNGALLTDNAFHNTGVPAVASLPADRGRESGAKAVLADEFNCHSRYSDAKEGECGELDFLIPEGDALVRAYKTPSLRDVALRAPYMHAGQIARLEDVVDHYNRAPQSPAGHSEIKPLRLSDRERAQLVAYLATLNDKPGR